MRQGERKGERTRKMIVERSAEVFNTKGYFGTSMSDLVRETGLEKGASTTTSVARSNSL
jgi:TetR/AcrR family transcriptional regulator, transcriptional repressor for nem operon